MFDFESRDSWFPRIVYVIGNPLLVLPVLHSSHHLRNEQVCEVYHLINKSIRWLCPPPSTVYLSLYNQFFQTVPSNYMSDKSQDSLLDSCHSYWYKTVHIFYFEFPQDRSVRTMSWYLYHLLIACHFEALDSSPADRLDVHVSDPFLISW